MYYNNHINGLWRWYNLPFSLITMSNVFSNVINWILRTWIFLRWGLSLFSLSRLISLLAIWNQKTHLILKITMLFLVLFSSDVTYIIVFLTARWSTPIRRTYRIVWFPLPLGYKLSVGALLCEQVWSDTYIKDTQPFMPYIKNVAVDFFLALIKSIDN